MTPTAPRPPAPPPAQAVRLPWMCMLAVTLTLVALATGCGGTDSTSTATGTGTPGGRVTVDAHRIAGLGTVLVTAAGHALYMFPPDHQHVVTCTGACAGTWPPLRVAAAGRPAAGPGVKQALLGTVRDPDGGLVVTYNGWPLYTYAADIAAYQANGQALDLNGAPWYVLRPSGDPLIPPAQSTTGTGS